MHGKRAATVVLAVALAGMGAVLTAGAASAHVTVNSTDAVQGGYSVLTFRVPTESAKASTTALKVQLPTDHPIASVSVQPHTGWSFTVKTTKLDPPLKDDDGEVTEAVSEIDWKADSAQTAIKPGEFDQFNISAGPLPDVSSLTFKAIQTYSDGSTVSWIEEAAPGSTVEPDHPAPTLKLAAATGASTSETATGATTGTRASAADSDRASTGAATTGIVLGAVGVVLGAMALLLVIMRGRRTAVTGS